MNIISKIDKYFKYINIIKNNKELLESLNLRVDWIYRLYTVYNLKPLDDFMVDVPQRQYLKKVEIQNFRLKLNEFCIKTNLIECVILKLEEIDDQNIFFQLSYKYIDIPKFIKKTIYAILLGAIMLGIYLVKK